MLLSPPGGFAVVVWLITWQLVFVCGFHSPFFRSAFVFVVLALVLAVVVAVVIAFFFWRCSNYAEDDDRQMAAKANVKHTDMKRE